MRPGSISEHLFLSISVSQHIVSKPSCVSAAVTCVSQQLCLACLSSWVCSRWAQAEERGLQSAPLAFVTVEEGARGVCRLLLQKMNQLSGSDKTGSHEAHFQESVNHVNTAGHSALHQAASEGRSEIVEQILRSQAVQAHVAAAGWVHSRLVHLLVADTVAGAFISG